MRTAPIPALPANRDARADTPAARPDDRYRRLLGPAAWAELPPDVRGRFARRPREGEAFVYAGRVLRARLSRWGWWLAQAGRLLGGPLRLDRDGDLPCLVTVGEDTDDGRQAWTLLHARRHGFPQVIHSAKHFAGPSGLEEHVGRGLGFSLRLSAAPDGLTSHAERYLLALAGRRLWLPRWLTPGRLTVRHVSVDFRCFIFTLTLDSPRLGRLVEQVIAFEEVVR